MITIENVAFPTVASIHDIRGDEWHAVLLAKPTAPGGPHPPRHPTVHQIVRRFEQERHPLVWDRYDLVVQDAIDLDHTPQIRRWRWTLFGYSTVDGSRDQTGLGYTDALPDALAAVEKNLADQLENRNRAEALLPRRVEVGGVSFVKAFPASDRVEREWCEVGEIHGRPVRLERYILGYHMAVTADGSSWRWSAHLDGEPERVVTDVCGTMLDALAAAERTAAQATLGGLLAVAVATADREDALRRGNLADEAWRAAIRDAVARSESVSAIAALVGVTRARVYQIRDNTR